MSKMIKKTVVITMVFLMILSGSAWAGWFSFEPNMLLLDGTRVALKLEDIEKEVAYLQKGDMEHADQLVNDNKVFVIKTGRDLTRVKFLDYKEENDGNTYIEVKDESGNKLWAEMSGLACELDGKKQNITKQELLKGEFTPLSETIQ
jgi:tRNA U34 2-thiouridine synthase MnmA/TrmU